MPPKGEELTGPSRTCQGGTLFGSGDCIIFTRKMVTGTSQGGHMPRRPKGYAGINHETIGSDILSVLRTLSLPEQILGAETAQALSSINPEGWYPIAMMLDLMERLHKAVGPYGMRKMGRTLFRMSHEE